jgi:hypothetical protein
VSETSIERALDGARRAGWAKFYQGRNDIAHLAGALRVLSATLDAGRVEKAARLARALEQQANQSVSDAVGKEDWPQEVLNWWYGGQDQAIAMGRAVRPGVTASNLGCPTPGRRLCK